MSRITAFYTDLYQITMSYAYYKTNKHQNQSVFECFFRKCPFKGQYAISTGIRQLIKFIKEFHFNQQDINYIKTILPHIEESFFQWLLKLDTKSLTIQTIPQGQLIFPHQPIVIIKGPLALAQLIQSPLLNILGFSILVATNAARICNILPDKHCIEFGLRRAQGPDGALSASEYSYIGGFHGTSNTEAGKRFNIKCFGTMAHSFICSFKSLDQAPEWKMNGVDLKERCLQIRKQKKFNNTNDGELAAFIAFGKCFPENFICLIDTYGTLQSGILNFVCIGLAMLQVGLKPKGIKLDSGDMAQLSIKCKQIFKKYSDVQIIVMATNQLNQDKIHQMNEHNMIDYFGIGSNLVTCQSQPYLGIVYKLVSLENEPRSKLSQQISKFIFPGKKNIFRIWISTVAYPIGDVFTNQDQTITENQQIIVIDKNNALKRLKIIPEKVQKLNEKIWDKGKEKKIRDIHV